MTASVMSNINNIMRKNSLRPHCWLSGPDPIDHKLYTDCQRARAQAWYRGEEWSITEQEYIELWRTDDRYLRKGKTSGSICMTKRDHDLDWTIDNVEFVERSEHFRRTHFHKNRGTKKMRQLRNKVAANV